MPSSDRSSNPVLNDKAFHKAGALYRHDSMTIDGVVNKSLFLLFLLCAAFIVVWQLAAGGNVNVALSAAGVGSLCGLLVCLIACFVPTSTPVTAPLYAICEGVAVGGLSSVMEWSYPGVVVQAVTVTFSVFFVLLLGYKMRIFRVSEGFLKGVLAMTLGLALVYLVNFGMSFFGSTLSIVTGSGWLAIGLSVLAAGLASMNLLLDFYFIERRADEGAPKYMEWYSAFGLLVTLVWLYLEVLRLLGKARD